MKPYLVTLALLLPVALGGCAVYGPPPPVAYEPYPVAGPVYAVPAPVYAEPVYVGPPVFFSFGYRSGGGHHRHWRR